MDHRPTTMDHRPYRHTQIGWPVYGVLIPVSLALVYALVTQELDIFVMATAILGLVFALFGWLTVDIDSRRLLIRFGVGLIRRTISLETIRAFAPVRNPWYYGWGIRLTPHGILYNVSGFSAVELLLDDGRRVRVGTDEPDALVKALERATHMSPARTVDEFPKDAAWRRRVRLVMVTIVALTAVFIVGQMYLYSRAPAVELAGGSVSVRVGLHGTTVPMDEVERIDLIETLPRIERRTNGFAAGGLLRGSFRLEQWGSGRLFINRNSPPFVVVRTSDSFVVVNFEDAARTRELYGQLTALAASQRPEGAGR